MEIRGNINFLNPMRSYNTALLNKSKAGFSLVELSIVLVIIGLLVGGVLVGKNLIHMAKLRNVITEFQAYQAAINTFIGKYSFLPGDMPNATEFWGVDGSGCPAGTGTTGTCNGDGDGSLGIVLEEHFLFWEHLSHAGLIKGNYLGAVAPSDHSQPATNYVPASKFSNAYWSFGHGGARPVNYGSLNPGIALTLGADGFASGRSCFGCGGVLRQEDAWGINNKLDDGSGNTGKIRSDMLLSGRLVDDVCNSYDLTNEADKCVLGFVLSE